jgi:hypothetical protein
VARLSGATVPFSFQKNKKSSIAIRSLETTDGVGFSFCISNIPIDPSKELCDQKNVDDFLGRMQRFIFLRVN